MDAIELLINDHNTVRTLFEQFRTAHEQQDTATMAQVAEQIRQELDVHTTIEEEVFYPAVRKADEDLGEEVAEALQEHHVVDILMNELQDLGPEDEEWVAKMQVLIENVEHHAGEEEQDMFPDVREAMDARQLQELGQQLLEGKEQGQRKEQGQSEAMSREELYAKAKELDIEGRSNMTKKQLQEAVQQAGG